MNIYELGQSEIRHFDDRVGIVVGAEQNVLWLEIPVTNILGVEVFDGGDDLNEIELGFLLLKLGFLDDFVE